MKKQTLDFCQNMFKTVFLNIKVSTSVKFFTSQELTNKSTYKTNLRSMHARQKEIIQK